MQVAKMPGLRRAPYFTDYVTAFVNRLPEVRRSSRRAEGVQHARRRNIRLMRRRRSRANLARFEKSRPQSAAQGRQKDRLESAMVALDATSGAIVAMVGGRDYAVEPVQSRDAGAAPARVRIQADRLSRRDGSGPLPDASAAHARLGAARSPDVVWRMGAGELRAHLSGPGDRGAGAGGIAQRSDRLCWQSARAAADGAHRA